MSFAPSGLGLEAAELRSTGKAVELRSTGQPGAAVPTFLLLPTSSLLPHIFASNQGLCLGYAGSQKFEAEMRYPFSRSFV